MCLWEKTREKVAPRKGEWFAQPALVHSVTLPQFSSTSCRVFVAALGSNLMIQMCRHMIPSYFQGKPLAPLAKQLR